MASSSRLCERNTTPVQGVAFDGAFGGMDALFYDPQPGVPPPTFGNALPDLKTPGAYPET
jgi:hypothetical protein